MSIPNRIKPEGLAAVKPVYDDMPDVPGSIGDSGSGGVNGTGNYKVKPYAPPAPPKEPTSTRGASGEGTGYNVKSYNAPSNKSVEPTSTRGASGEGSGYNVKPSPAVGKGTSTKPSAYTNIDASDGDGYGRNSIPTEEKVPKASGMSTYEGGPKTPHKNSMAGQSAAKQHGKGAGASSPNSPGGTQVTPGELADLAYGHPNDPKTVKNLHAITKRAYGRAEFHKDMGDVLNSAGSYKRDLSDGEEF